jgi:hypothetical protein
MQIKNAVDKITIDFKFIDHKSILFKIYFLLIYNYKPIKTLIFVKDHLNNKIQLQILKLIKNPRL